MIRVFEHLSERLRPAYGLRMPSVPRIRRATPNRDQVFLTDKPIAVIACLRWNRGGGQWAPEEYGALAIGWTYECVQIEWEWEGTTRRDWIDASDIRRVVA